MNCCNKIKKTKFNNLVNQNLKKKIQIFLNKQINNYSNNKMRKYKNKRQKIQN